MLGDMDVCTLPGVSWRDEWRRQCYRGLNRPALNRDRFFML